MSAPKRYLFQGKRQVSVEGPQLKAWPPFGAGLPLASWGSRPRGSELTRPSAPLSLEMSQSPLEATALSDKAEACRWGRRGQR